MTDIKTEVQKAFEVVKNGGIILYPTDTVWGIGCDATNSEAVKKIFALKKRAESKSMIALVSGDRMLYQIFNEIPETAFQIWEVTDKPTRSEEHTSELQSRPHLVCRLLLEKKKK